mgnify:FL=1
MTLVKFNGRPVSRPLDSIFDNWFSGFPVKDFNPFDWAAVNIDETKDAYLLELSAPGLNKEDIKLNLENGLLTISYDKKEESRNEDKKSVRREFSYRSFKRSFNLDEQVDSDTITASYENGILKVNLPKKAEAKPASKQISVQ